MPFIIYQKKNKTEVGRSFVRSILDDVFFSFHLDFVSKEKSSSSQVYRLTSVGEGIFIDFYTIFFTVV